MAQHSDAGTDRTADAWTRDRVATALAATDLGDRLDRLGLRPEDRDDALPHLRGLSADDHDKVAAAAELLVGQIGRIDRALAASAASSEPTEGQEEEPSWPPPTFAGCPDEPGRPQGLLPLAALILTADQVTAWHAGRGIDPADSAHALSDLGQQVWVHRLTFGEFGLHTYPWLTVGWSGVLFWLGRLQFNLQREGADWVISTHIPQSGPLTPAAVDDAFGRARAFFATHFADVPTTAFFCHSWLLDPQLVEVLAPQTNMAAFQQRWQRVEVQGSGDGDALFFVFHRRYDWDTPGGPDLGLDTLPQTTTLERAIVARLRAGGHWQVCSGVIPFAPATREA